MKKIVFSMAAGLLMLVACAQQQQKVVTDNEPTTITWIADKPEPNLQPHQLFPDVPDSLWNALGLQEGVRSSMSCFLLQTEGKQILFDAGLGAPFSQLLPKLKELGVKAEELQLIYITSPSRPHRWVAERGSGGVPESRGLYQPCGGRGLVSHGSGT